LNIITRCLLLFSLPVFLLAVCTPALATVGMLQQGESIYIFDVNFSTAKKQWDVNRNVLTSLCKSRNFGNVHKYEYGYSYFHTVFASATLAYRRCGNGFFRRRVPGAPPGFRIKVPFESGRASGLGDVTIGVRTRFNNYLNNAAWEALLIIPTGYDNASPSALGRGALGLGLGLIFSSVDKPTATAKAAAGTLGWKAGSRFVYSFSGKGNRISSFAELRFAFTDTDFKSTGDFAGARLGYNLGLRAGGVQQALFINQTTQSLSSSDQTTVQLNYSHSFRNGYSFNSRISRAIFGKNAPVSTSLGLGFSYRWRD
jgi:hypothetical protein